MIGRRETNSEDRAITPIIAIVALIAVSVTLAAVLGAWMLGDYANAGQDVTAQVEVSYVGGNVVVHWTKKGSAEHIRVLVGTQTAKIKQVEGVARLPGTAKQTVIVVAEGEKGRESVVFRSKLSDV